MANPRGIDPAFTVSAISGGIRVYKEHVKNDSQDCLKYFIYLRLPWL